MNESIANLSHIHTSRKHTIAVQNKLENVKAVAVAQVCTVQIYSMLYNK